MHRHHAYRAQHRHPLILLLDNVDKAPNIGGILRTADAFLAESVLVNRAEPDVAGAMGAEHWQPVEWKVDLVEAIGERRRLGYALVVLEQEPDAVPIREFRFPMKTMLAVGAEMYGVSKEVQDMADATVFIPQAGLVKSLNVTTAAAIAVYEYSRQHWMGDFAQPARHLEPAISSMRVETRKTNSRATSVRE
ncbi:MAG TPA: TrmH family RNA methyltransferase [Chloroflexota bacterium]|jgi:tRNA G18 (ribose-2'-O)-methylase SpoU|nr:TrmH family RNA methyltransferase [Chloroflexota bacterium]